MPARITLIRLVKRIADGKAPARQTRSDSLAEAIEAGWLSFEPGVGYAVTEAGREAIREKRPRRVDEVAKLRSELRQLLLNLERLTLDGAERRAMSERVAQIRAWLPVEAYGVKGPHSKSWRRVFPNRETALDWAAKVGASIAGWRLQEEV